MRTSVSLGMLLVVATMPTAARLGAQADSMVLTFEEFTTSGPGTGGQVRLTEPYAGVRFNAPWVLDYARGLAAPGFAHSGTRAIVLCYAVEFCADTTFQLRFDQPRQRVRVWVGMSRSPDRPVEVTMVGFGLNRRPVARARAVIAAGAPARIETPLEVRADSNRITAVTVAAQNGSGSDFALDDVQLWRAAPAPPPPVPPQDRFRRVPDVTGRTLEDAARFLADSGFRIGPRRWVKERGPAATVWRQEPPPGTSARIGSPVALDLVVWVTVPDVTRRSREAAERILADSGFTARIGEEVRALLPVGTVATQSPPPGASAPVGDPVTLDVVIGPPPPPPPVQIEEDQFPWPLVVGILIVASAVTIAAVRGRRARRRPGSSTVSTRLASTGLDRQGASMEEPRPFDLEIRFSPRADAAGVVEYTETGSAAPEEGP